MHGTDASTSIEEFQAYEPAKINDNVLKAIENTRGKVIKYNGEYVKGWYSACCGGKTAGALEGLNWDKTKTPLFCITVKGWVGLVEWKTQAHIFVVTLATGFVAGVIFDIYH